MYAISTPIDEQYSGDGIVARGPAYGIHSIRVDGNDVFAVHNAVRIARELIINTKTPALIECMTYRGGDHSTSDSSKSYRDQDEMKKWAGYLEEIGDPIQRFYSYLLKKEWITQKEYEDIAEDAKLQVRSTLKDALEAKKPSVDSLFDDVYDRVPQHLEDQKNKLKDHLKKYPEIYKLSEYKEN
jgi:2-oxoisovalerate dehydrogenase E1 component alpha subunit